jgi:hypothetical protein
MNAMVKDAAQFQRNVTRNNEIEMKRNRNVWKCNRNQSEKTCASATLSTTNPTWPDPGSNPGRRGGKPATNHLSYGAV